jgi:D-alanyl-D-alanine carboxypeptidase/D-alanyl-D-alanine-endopeptidase (penicillin-binding protein 4)
MPLIKRSRGRISGLASCWLLIGVELGGCGPGSGVDPLDGIGHEERLAAPAPRYAFSWRADGRRLDDDVEATRRLEAKLGAFSRRVEAARSSLAPAPNVAFDPDRLRVDVESIVARLGPGARVGVHVRDLASDTVLFDLQGDTLLNPASNHKVLTSSGVIDLVGADYRFETTARWDGSIVYVQGTGDPLLDPTSFETMADQIVARIGIAAEVEAVMVDDSAFSGHRLAPGFDAGGAGVSYQAPSGALSANFNTVEVVVYPIAGSKRTAVKVRPSSTHVRVSNRSRRGTGRLFISTRPAPSPDGPVTLVEVGGSTLSAQTQRRRVSDPGLFAGGILASEIADRQETVPAVVLRGAPPAEAEIIAVHVSEEVLEAVSGVLAFSNNFVAEQLLRTLGWRITGAPGDWENGSEVLRGYWAALGNAPEHLEFENGSGLSVMGRVTPVGLVNVLSVGHRLHRGQRGLVDALPIAGLEGTVKSRLQSTNHRVRAKTGTLDGVSGLTGVITDAEGVPDIAFSILINEAPDASGPHRRRKRVEDDIVEAVLEAVDEQLRAG